MRKYIFVILVILGSVWQLTAKKQATGNRVLFGENNTRMDPADSNTMRIFIDRNGDYYPPGIWISDKALYKSGGSLRDWYRQNPDSFNAICGKFGMPASGDLASRVVQLNEVICKHYATITNQKSNKRVFMLIHGFRKRAYDKPDLFTYLATTDNEILKETIGSMTPGKNIFYLEIYWDACYFKPAKALKEEGFVIFRDQAVPNANHVGAALRQLVTDLDTHEINIVTHSLGARVACNLLFNVSAAPASSLMIPQNKKIKICFIAPAVASEIFENFYQRSQTDTMGKPDNYEIEVVYNRYDYLLLKQGRILGIKFSDRGATAFANTSLGCDYNGDIKKLQGLFATKFTNTNPPTLIDVTAGKSMMNHLVKSYCHNPKFRNVRF